MEREGADELVVTRAGDTDEWTETFRYQFGTVGGQPWVERLRWEWDGPERHWVEIRFEDPEASTQSPLRWEASSDRGR